MRRRVLALCAPLVAGASCLPGDTRPPPAEVTVTASSSSLTLNDIPAAATADDFDIVIERLLVNIGQAELVDAVGSGPCNDYSNPGYTRLFDFKRVTAPREVGIAFATGHCAVGFSLRFPNYATVVDLGATSDDATLMRTAGSDPVAKDAGVSVYIEGLGVQGELKKHFAWPFRKRVGYTGCAVPDPESATGAELTLASNQKTSVNLEIHAEALFQSRPQAFAHFAPYAQADADGDGEIAFDELWTVPLADVIAAGFEPPPDVNAVPVPTAPGGPIDPAYSCYDSDGNLIAIQTLGDYAYCELLPALVRYEGTGACNVTLGRSKNDN